MGAQAAKKLSFGEVILVSSSADSSESGGASLLTEGLVLPQQLARRPSFASTSTGRLMRAVLEDAVDCFSQRRGGNLAERLKLHREAAAWIFSDDPSWPFSFVNVCDSLGVDPSRLRQRLLQ